MEYLVIYDLSGYIYNQFEGNVRVPEGLPYMMVEIPEGKVLKSIDVTNAEHVPVFEDAPVPEVHVLQERLELLEAAFNYLALQ